MQINLLCGFCKKEIEKPKIGKRFCNQLCQRKDYNRRPEIREKYRLRIKEYRRTHPEWKEKHRIQQAKYKERNKKYRKEYYSRPEIKIYYRDKAREKRRNPSYVIADRLRRSLHHALTKYSKTGKIMHSREYGIDWKKVIEKLKPFPKDLNGYEIDHIIPLRAFNLENPEEIKKAFAPENLRWLTMVENRSKGGRLINIV